MTRITLEIPNEMAMALKVPPEGVADAVRMAAAVKLLEMRKLSSGAAAMAKKERRGESRACHR